VKKRNAKVDAISRELQQSLFEELAVSDAAKTIGPSHHHQARNALGDWDDEEIAREVSYCRPPIVTSTSPAPVIVEPTASKTDRFLGCSLPWGRPQTDNEVSLPARFGSAFHAVLESRLRGKRGREAASILKATAAKFDVDAKAVSERVDAVLPVLKAWLVGENPWKIRFTDKAWRLSYEETIAYNIETQTSRRCDPPTSDTHEYRDRQPHEIPGAVDLLGVGIDEKTKRFNGFNHNTVLILDHKSGFDVGSPMESGQLKTLALAASKLFACDKAIVAFMHAPAGMTPTIYADTLDSDDFARHATSLQEAESRRDSGFIRPDFYCRYCQVFSSCPVNQPALIELRGSRQLQTAEDVGEAHQKLQEMTKRFSSMADVIDAEIRSWIRQHGAGVRPDGREVDFVERPFTNLSQASIVRALGKLEGGRMIEKLKKLGAIESGVRKELRVK
jgi:hypothetical protein